MAPALPASGSHSPQGKRKTAAPDRQAEIPHDLFCQKCGYNLRALTGDHCPECGHSLGSIRSRVSQLPWIRRKELGWFRAYWRTVWMVMFRQGAFCEEMARPVSYSDAQRFRWLTVLHVYVPILLATVAYYAFAPPRSVKPFEDRFFYEAFAAVWPMAVLHVCFVLFLAAATGVPSYFFHPRDVPVELQNRAIALSYYACGPLAIVLVPFIAGSAAYVIGMDEKLALGLLLFAILFPCGQLAVWWLDLIHITRRIMPQRRDRAALVALSVPTLWGLLAGLILFGIPLSVLYVLLLFVSQG